ncbi:uncharacterized protein LOC116264645 isoform X2 [Nymphaea colorata]|uniref:uncharacterized protein LOC116264645 isoform X2 n=1 Tax=Nymphaea colorata TaxID=210225 RepID=UPI00129E8232|nr:uncharacterized protein LOC116264645 isoform X2 [Nymphaea colorata]
MEEINDKLLDMHGRYSFLHQLLESDSKISSANVEILSSMDAHCGHCRTSSDDVMSGCHDVSHLASLSHNLLSLYDTVMHPTGVRLNDALNESNLAAACSICPMHQQQASCSLGDTAWAHLPASSVAIKDKGPCLRLLRDDVTKANPLIIDSSSQIPVGIPRYIVLPFSPMKDKCGSSFLSETATCSPAKLSHDYHVKLLGSTVAQAEIENHAYFSNNAGRPSKTCSDNKDIVEAGIANSFMDRHEGNPTVFEPHPTASIITSDATGRCLSLRKCPTTNSRSSDERKRRQRISKALKAMRELLPSSENGNQISVLDDVIDYVKVLQLQTKVLSQTRLLSDLSEDTLVYLEGFGHFSRTEPESSDAIENIIDNLMKSDMPAAIQSLQRKGLHLLPWSSADCFKNAS